MNARWWYVGRWGTKWAVYDGHYLSPPPHPTKTYDDEISAIAEAARRNHKPRKKPSR